MFKHGKIFVLGLTGPSGAGKSTAAQIFASRGWAVVDADKTAREATAKGSECLGGLVRCFGRGILLPDGSLDRHRLAQLAFADAQSLKKLDSLTHPYIVEAIDARLGALADGGARAAVLDAPALYEAGADKLCGRVLAVVSGAEGRRRRVMERDGLTKDEADRRFSAQHDDSYYVSRADYVIANDAGREAFAFKVNGLIDRMEKEELFPGGGT
jgi:dephospho-CoA kinase